MAAARAKPNLTRLRMVAALAAAPQRSSADHVVLRLPVPPSSNRVWAHSKGGGMRLSDAYSRWLSDAGWRLKEQRPGKVSGGYELALFLPAASKMDLDNSIAGVSDLLQSHGVIDNDSFAEVTDLRWHGTHEDVVVTVKPFHGSPRHLRPIPGDVEVSA